MQVRIFESPDMTSGLKMIKKELGPDALILSTRTVRSGKMGLLSKPMLEITAAIDPEYPGSSGRKKDVNKYGHCSGSPRQAKKDRRFTRVVDDRLDTCLLSGNRSPAGQVSYPTFRSAGESQPSLEGEVNELRGLVTSLAGQLDQLASAKNSGAETVGRSSDTTPAPQADATVPDAWHTTLHSLMTERGIDPETSERITAVMRQRFPAAINRVENLPGLLLETIEDMVRISPPDFQSAQGQHRIALIGPTGVGKTTTLAKIAANYLSNFSRAIALITIDTYRIAAVEQLKVYGEIMHLPVEVVINPAQLQEALGKHNDKDLILIDTAGRSPRDNFCIDELGSFLRPEHSIEKHLVVSATTRDNELVETARRFSRLTVDKLIFTKIDECASLGALINLQMRDSAPLAYMTNGQRVPEDLLQVDPKIVAELIMTHYQGTMHE